MSVSYSVSPMFMDFKYHKKLCNLIIYWFHLGSTIYNLYVLYPTYSSGKYNGSLNNFLQAMEKMQGSFLVGLLIQICMMSHVFLTVFWDWLQIPRISESA
jgi:hypothetical protein